MQCKMVTRRFMWPAVQENNRREDVPVTRLVLLPLQVFLNNQALQQGSGWPGETGVEAACMHTLRAVSPALWRLVLCLSCPRPALIEVEELMGLKELPTSTCCLIITPGHLVRWGSWPDPIVFLA
jgi:hypothetical protein